MHVQPYLFFEGRCEEAIEFYRSAVGAQVQMLLRYRDNPEASTPGQLPAGSQDKVMHASFSVGETTLMASDGLCSGKPSFQGFSLSVAATDDADAQRLFAALSAGGQVHQPLMKTFFASSFGMTVDRFGLGWMVIAGQQG